MDIRLQDLPLHRLCLSPNNPRKTPASPEDHASMVASIAAVGLINPLVVDPFDDTTNQIGVAAGGRRLAAYQDLAAQGRVPSDHPILCYACPEGTDPAEIAVIENMVRAAMHPADQFVSFSNLAAQGHALEEIANRFGTSVRTVERRLSLAKVDPSLLDAYRADEMNLDTLMAFTMTTDHELQRKVWKAAQNQPSYWRNDADFVHRSLTEKRITAKNRLARFATLDAYEAAGGCITRDLFAESDSEVWLDDPQIAHDVCSQRLEARAEKLRPDWAWVQITVDVPDYGMLNAYGRYAPQPSDEEAARLAEISQRIEAIEDDDTIEYDAGRTEIKTLEKESSSLERKVSRRTIPKEYREKSGCIVGIDMSGNLSIIRGLIRPEDMPTETETAGNDGVSVSATTSTSPARTAASKVPKCYTDSHAAVMRSLRTSRLQVQLARNPDVARDILLLRARPPAPPRMHARHLGRQGPRHQRLPDRAAGPPRSRRVVRHSSRRTGRVARLHRRLPPPHGHRRRQPRRRLPRHRRTQRQTEARRSRLLRRAPAASPALLRRAPQRCARSRHRTPRHHPARRVPTWRGGVLEPPQ